MKPSLPQGTRDFGPETVRRRNYIFSTIKTVFELYGFEPLETPAMENLETLIGKYGDEGDKLIFKIRSNKDLTIRFPKLRDSYPYFIPEKSDRALRYDLTIPFARYVAMNYNKLIFPFKRYQIQPVWRGDRPQKGRYREFYQCDADIVGSNSLLNEIELANIYADVFKKLEVNIEIKINNRKILTALAEICNASDQMMEMTIAIDKLDKIGLGKVKEELLQRGFNEDQIGIIESYLFISRYSGDNEIILQQLKVLFNHNLNGNEGIKDLEIVLEDFKLSNPNFFLKNKILIDPTLARGLNYYTGMIYEVKSMKVQIGSIGGGGRYNDLTGLFDLPKMPGVGISFGVDRIYDVMEELNLFPESIHTGTKVLFFNLGEEESKFAFARMQMLRSEGISCEIFHEPQKLEKQFKYATKKNIQYAIIIGTKEIQEKNCVIKDLKTSNQESIALNEIKNYFKNK